MREARAAVSRRGEVAEGGREARGGAASEPRAQARPGPALVRATLGLTDALQSN